MLKLTEVIVNNKNLKTGKTNVNRHDSDLTVLELDGKNDKTGSCVNYYSVEGVFEGVKITTEEYQITIFTVEKHNNHYGLNN